MRPPVGWASWPDVGDHQWAGLVPVFVGSTYRGGEEKGADKKVGEEVESIGASNRVALST